MPTLDRLSSHAFKIRYIAVHKILTLEYLKTVHHLLNVNGKLDLIWLAKKDNLML